MALDVNDLGNKHNTAVTAKAGPLLRPLAGVLVNGDQLIHQVGEEEFKRRATVATAAMRGDNEKLRSVLLGDLDADQQQLLQQILTGQLTKNGLDQLQQRANQAQQQQQSAQAQQPALQGSVITPSQELTTAVNDTATIVTNAATAAEEAKNLIGNVDEAIDRIFGAGKKEVKTAFNALKSKVEATLTTVVNAEHKAVEAKNHLETVQQQGGNAPQPAQAQQPATQLLAHPQPAGTP